MNLPHPTIPWAPARLLCLCLALSACGGGGYEAPPTNATPPFTPGQAPFIPGPGDLPRAADLYPYDAAPLLTWDLLYQATPASGPGWYQVDKRQCQFLPSPPPSYPGSMVTLETVNLDEDKADACEPEIKVLATSSDGQVQNASAKLRLRGSSTRQAELKSYRVKFSEKTTAWTGEDTLQLNKHPWDLTRVRNKLAFDLMRRVPYHESLRTQFAQIRYSANATSPAQTMGLYTHVEKMGKSYLQRRGWVAGSNVYKAEEFDFGSTPQLATLQGGKAGADFEKVLGIESDSGQHQTIVDAVAALNNEDRLFVSTFNRYFDRNNYLAWLATTILLGNWDTRTQNFGLYQPLGSEKFYFLPWDYDAALGFAQQPGEHYPQWAQGIGNWWNSPLHRRFLSTTGAIELLKAAVQDIRSKHLTDAAVAQLLESYRPMVEPYITRAPDDTHLAANGTGSPAQQWAAEYQRLHTVIGYNHAQFLQSLERPTPFWLGASDKTGALVLDWGWPAPFHPQGKPISYQVQVAQAQAGTPAFAPPTLLPGPAPISGKTSANLGSLPAGQYLVRVTASDPDGNSSTAFDSTRFGGQVLDGAICLQLPGASRCQE